MEVHDKIKILTKVGKIILNLHKENECYSDLSVDTVLLDPLQEVYLSAAITKSIPPHTNGLTYDIHLFLMLIYHLFTDTLLSHDILLAKQARQDFFCSFSHRCQDPLIGSFLHEADILFGGQTDLGGFLQRTERLALA